MKQVEENKENIARLHKNFGKFKNDVDVKFSEIMEKLNKPLMSDKQIFGLIITLIVYLILSVRYVSATDLRSIKNEKEIEERKKTDEKILDVVMDIQTRVARIEGQNENKSK